jgi:predicted ATPase
MGKQEQSELNKEIKNDKKVVIIGRSSSGKTTLIKEISSKGYQIIEEVARGILEERKNIPATFEESNIRQNLIYQKQLYLENSSNGLVFLDRGLVDVLGYTKYFNVNDSFMDKQKLIQRYHLVFELEKRPFVHDGTRIEKDEDEADLIYSFVRKSYIELGYNLILVPNFHKDSKENALKRVSFILNQLEEKN